MDFNPLWILVALAVFGSIVKGLFWLRDVHNMKEGWQAFAKEIRDDIKKIFERIPPPITLEAASPLRLSELGKTISKSLNAAEWAAKVAPGLDPEVAGKQPFEIDQFSDEYVERRLDAQDTEWVAKQAYESGVTPAAVRAVLRVLLRDELIRRIEQARS